MRLLTDFDAGVMTLSLNRPERLNAIDEATAEELLNALESAEAAPDVRVIVLRGNGRAFCAGRDVTQPATPGVLDAVQAVARAIVVGRKPVIFSVHGWVIGAGAQWMLDGDIVVAGRTARFRLPEVELGTFVTGGVTTILPRLAGLARAKGVLLLGEEFSAEQARDWGLLWAVFDDAELKRQTERIAKRLAGFDPQILGRFKRVLHELNLADFDASLAAETRTHREMTAREAR